MAPKNQPMRGFLRGALTRDQIFSRLVEDFEAAGKRNVTLTSKFIGDPPDGLGYGGLPEFQSFLNSFVNSPDGKTRYNQPADHNIKVIDVRPTKTVGNLVLEIDLDQIK
jgi:hypothetical protein